MIPVDESVKRCPTEATKEGHKPVASGSFENECISSYPTRTGFPM